MRRDIRIKYMFTGREEERDYNPSLYIKSDWQPPNANAQIEHRIDKFETMLSSAREQILNNTRPSSNLSSIQQNLMKTMKDNPDFIIVNTDKNLGPAIIEREVYIKNILTEHLNTKTYKSITANEAHDILVKLERELTFLVTIEHERDLTDGEKQYFQQALATSDRIAQFYGTAKVHKDKVNGQIPLWSVNS